MVILTIDRCIMIRWPFRYQTLPTWVQIHFLAASPLSAVVAMLIGFLSESKGQFAMENPLLRKAMLFGISLLWIALFVANSIVHLAVYKQKNAIRAVQVGQESSEDRATRIRRDAASFYACFGYVITYIVLWMPELTRQYIWYFTGKDIEGVFVDITLIVVNFNPLCDAFVFVYFNRELKSHLRKIFFRKTQQEQDQYEQHPIY